MSGRQVEVDALITWGQVIVILAVAWMLVHFYGQDATEPTPLYIVPTDPSDAGVEYRLLDEAGLNAFCERRIH